MVKDISKLHIFIQLKIYTFILLLLLLSGCFSVKPTTTKSGKNYFETFYVGADGTQYYIKPLLFKDDDSNDELFVDITFRYKNEIRDSAIVNFSIKSQIIYKTIDSLKISNNLVVIKNDKIELLFNEKTRKEFVSRFTTKISLNEIKQLFNKDEWNFVIYYKNQKIKYKSHRRTEKAINTLRNKVFIIM